MKSTKKSRIIIFAVLIFALAVVLPIVVVLSQPISYTVTLNYNNGMPDKVQTVDGGTDFVLPTPDRDGYEFLGWEYVGSFSQNRPVEGAFVKITMNTTLRALWQIKTYSISYNADNGVLPDNAVKSFTVETMSEIRLPVLASGTMAFSYWAADAEGKTKVEKISECKDYVLYAVWEKAEAAMTFVYDAARNGYCLTKYDGNATIVEVPAVHKGLPVVEISDNAFSESMFGKSVITSVSIPDGITKIGNSAFMYCKELESVSIPDSVQIIGSRAFSGCKSLKNIKLPNGLTEISNYMFDDCTSLESVAIPPNVHSINTYAFYNCRSLKNIFIPNGVQNIYFGAFADCTSLESIVLPPSLISINQGAFNDCKLKKLYIRHDWLINQIDGYFEGIDSAELFVKSDIAVENEYINFVYEKSPTAEVVDGVEYFRYTKKQ